MGMGAVRRMVFPGASPRAARSRVSHSQLKEAVIAVKTCSALQQALLLVLKAGNILNRGTPRVASGFSVLDLYKARDLKTTDNSKSLMEVCVCGSGRPGLLVNLCMGPPFVRLGSSGLGLRPLTRLRPPPMNVYPWS